MGTDAGNAFHAGRLVARRLKASGLPAAVNVLTDPDVAYPRRSNLA